MTLLIDDSDEYNTRFNLIADCGKPPVIPRTTIKGLEGGTLEGATIMYYCDENTDPSGNPTSVCTKDGVWSPVTIKCTRKSLLWNHHLWN